MAVITTIAGLPGLGGVTFEPSPWVRIDAGMVRAFAQLTGDHQWIHVDEERTAAAGHGLVAHGYLLLSLIPSLSDPMLTVTRSEEHTSELQSLMRISYAVLCFKKK